MKKKLPIIIINAALLIGAAVCQIATASLTSPLQAGNAARAWAGQSGERFAQLAVFFPASYTFDEEKRHQLCEAIDIALLNASLEAEEGRRLYTDAWSADGTVTAAGERGTSEASVTGVGGDYFLFHPLYLRDGSYISQNDIMQDRVILDEDLAWRLYGSVNLTGLEVVINGRPFIIAGVVARESDKASSKAYSGGAGMYMSYEMLNAMTGGGARINSYEIVMPDLVTDFAASTLSNALGDGTLHIIDSSARFSFTNLLSIIGSFGERGMRTEPVAYPYWENATRYAEDWAALMLFVSLLMLACPIVFACIYMVKLTLFGIRKAKGAVRYLIIKRDNRKYEEYLAKQKPSIG